MAASNPDALRNWRICREFQKAVDEIKADIFEGQEVDPLSRRLDEARRESSKIVNDLLDSADREVTLQSFFATWREVAIEDVKSKQFKADYFYSYVLMQSHFNLWKTQVRWIKQQRLLEEIEAEERRQKVNWIKATAFEERNLSYKYLKTWRAYTRLMAAKKHLRSLESKKEKSRQKVNNFLRNLESLKKTKPKQKADPKPGNPTKTTILREKLLQGPKANIPELEEEAKRRRKPLQLAIKENQIEHQKLVIESQRSRLKQQQRQIDDLKKMNDQMDKGFPVTNKSMYKSLLKITKPDCQSPLDELRFVWMGRKFGQNSVKPP